MYQNYKVVANSAVGRRRYLKYLLPQVLDSDIVDRYDLWVNTLNAQDIAFFKAMAAKYPKLNLMWHPTGVINGVTSMLEFYPTCVDDDTIYIKLDDDVVWFDPNFFEEICRFRVENRDYFLVSPLVINNGICNYILQNRGLVEFTEYLTCDGYNLRTYNGHLAEQLQRRFIDDYLRDDSYSRLYCGENRIAMQRFAINAVAWFGSEFAKFGGRVTGDDEEFLTVKYPVAHDLLCCFDCNTIVSHFSFSAQRAHLDRTDLLDQYRAVLLEHARPSLRRLLLDTEALLAEVDSLPAGPLPDNYRPAQLPAKQRRNARIHRFVGMLLGVPMAHREHVGRSLFKIIKSNRRYLK